MCGSNKTTTTTSANTSQTQKTGPSQAVQDEGWKLYNQASALAAKPLPTYKGERVADYGQEFEDVRAMLQGLRAPSADMGKARTNLDNVMAATDTTSTIAERMNPYVGTVLDANLRRMAEAHQQNQ